MALSVLAVRTPPGGTIPAGAASGEGFPITVSSKKGKLSGRLCSLAGWAVDGRVGSTHRTQCVEKQLAIEAAVLVYRHTGGKLPFDSTAAGEGQQPTNQPAMSMWRVESGKMNRLRRGSGLSSRDRRPIRCWNLHLIITIGWVVIVRVVGLRFALVVVRLALRII